MYSKYDFKWHSHKVFENQQLLFYSYINSYILWTKVCIVGMLCQTLSYGIGNLKASVALSLLWVTHTQNDQRLQTNILVETYLMLQRGLCHLTIRCSSLCQFKLLQCKCKVSKMPIKVLKESTGGLLGVPGEGLIWTICFKCFLKLKHNKPLSSTNLLFRRT